MNPVDRRPPPPTNLARTNVWAAQHPVAFALTVGCAVAVAFPAFVWATGRGHTTASDLVSAGVAWGTLMGVQALFLVRPVERDRLPRTLGIVAVVGWVATLVLGADLFLGGIIVAGFVVAAYAGNVTALAKRNRSEQARATYASSDV